MWPLVRLWAAAECTEQSHHCPRNDIKSILWSNTSGIPETRQHQVFYRFNKNIFLLPRVQTEEMIICVSEHVPLLRRTVFTAQLPFCTVDTINFSALQLTFSLFFLIDYLSSHTNLLTFSAANVCNKCNLCMSANVYIELILYWSSSSS